MDGSEVYGYRLTNGSNAVQISSKKGRTFSNSALPPGMLQRLSNPQMVGKYCWKATLPIAISGTSGRPMPLELSPKAPAGNQPIKHWKPAGNPPWRCHQNRWHQRDPLTDANGDGFVDNWSTYRLTNGSNAVQISSKDALSPTPPLPPGMLQRLSNPQMVGKYCWKATLPIAISGTSGTNASGVITKGSGWKSTDQALEAGWESTFGDVIKIDGINGIPSPTPMVMALSITGPHTD